MAQQKAGAHGIFPFDLQGYSEGDLRVVSFRGLEKVSRPYVFDILLNAPKRLGDKLEDSALGAKASLGIEGVELPRAVHGIVQSVQRVTDFRLNVGEFYRMRVVPRLWLLKKSRTSRIFQDMTVPQIVTAVLDQHRVEHQWRLTGSYKPRIYCVQHQETDWRFIRRLLSEEGMFFFFEHPPVDSGKAEQMVMGDHTSAYVPIVGNSVLPLRDNIGSPDEEYISEFEVRKQLETGSLRTKEFDFKRPSLDMQALVKTDEPVQIDESALESYHHHGHFEDDDIDEAEAALHLDQIRTRRIVGYGRSWCTRILPGATFALAHAPAEQLNRRFVTVQVDHEGHNVELEGALGMRGNAEEQPDSYKNSFECLPDNEICRPPRVAWRIQQTLETATVVGPEGEEIYTDEYGRIKVQFHWDLQGKRDEYSSCWMRVMQNWSGVGWGFQFIPRIGMEVLVMFVGGDEDKPMVIGCVYNGEHPHPFHVPKAKTISGIRTRSTLDSDGFNELSFEDLAGWERIHIHAQRNFDEKVLNDHSTTVDNDQLNQVGNNQTEKVDANQTLTVGLDRTVSVGANAVSTVAGNLISSASGNQRTHISGERRDEVCADRIDIVGAAFRQRVTNNHASEVGGDLTFLVNGDHRMQVKGKRVNSVMGDALDVVKGDHNAVISGQQTIAVAKATNATFKADVNATTTAKAVLQADEGFVLCCGESRIEIGPDEIKLTSPKLKFVGGDEATLAGGSSAALKLDGNADLTAPSVPQNLSAQINTKVNGSGSSVLLNGAAQVLGASVSLGGGGGSSASVSDSAKTENAEPTELAVQLYEPDSEAAGEPKPLANVDVTATGHGPEPFSGSTDGSGVLKIPVYYDKCVIDVKAGDYSLQLHAGGLDDEDEEKAAKQRLYNLGYGPADLDQWDEKETAMASGGFQNTNALAHWKGIDEATKSALKGKAGA